MKNWFAWMAVAIALAFASSARAEFTPPTAGQIAQAATNSTAVASLVKDATPDQAAEVMKLLLREIAGLPIPVDARSTLVEQAVKAVFGAFPPAQSPALAAALGTAIVNAGLADQPYILSAVQKGLASLPPAVAPGVVAAFGSAVASTTGVQGAGRGPADISVPVLPAGRPTPPKPAPVYPNQ